MNIKDLFLTALDKRAELLNQLHQEDTNAYRLFHGTIEGLPGVTVDRYGPQILIQSFHSSLDSEDRQAFESVIPAEFEINQVSYNDRSARNSRRRDEAVVDDDFKIASEFGINYKVQSKHKGQDPYLFLDFRAARRQVLKIAEGKSVLNLFSYTSTVGIAAAMAGASEVFNIDFSDPYLEVGKANQELNHLAEYPISFFRSDFFPAIRQLAGLPVKQRGKPRPYPNLAAKTYDLVVLDPPRWSKSPFGTVDLIRDYQSLLKPSLLAASEGGQVLCSNNVSKVSREDWGQILTRCAEKAGRPLKSLEWIQPESDFPSRDGNPPLKIALLQL